MIDRKEIVTALDELWQGFADTLRLRHEYDPNDDAVMVVIHERDIELLRNVSILLEEQQGEILMMNMVYGSDCKVVGELVRCKDCQHWTKEEDKCLEIGMCRVHERRFVEDWFCADGERK